MDKFNKYKFNILNKKRVLLVLSTLLFFVVYLDFNYYSNLFEDFFAIDDAILVQIPQMRAPFGFSLLRSLFTFGNHIDYYPIRDLSYWFDVNILGGSSTNTFAFKVMNFFYFYIFLIFLFFILKQLTKDQLISALATLAWGINPFHNEMLFWVSARKDLLFLTFFSVSVYAFIKSFNKFNKKTIYFFIGVVFYTLACFTKASGSLAILAIPFYYFISKLYRRSNFFKSLFLFGLSLFFIFINKINYSAHNSMYFDYTFDYRFQAIMSSLGRSFVGLFFSGFNGMDFENWGEWAHLNHSFFIFGLCFIVAFILFFCVFIKKQKMFWIFIVLIILTLTSIPGVNPLHRNFYSVRYYELPFLTFYTAIIVYLSNYTNISKNKINIILIIFIIFFIVSHKIESPHWKSNLAIVEKSLNLTPLNPALMKNYLVEYELIKRWNKQSLKDDLKAKAVAQKIFKVCSVESFELKNDKNGNLCLNFWIFKESFPSFPDLIKITANQRYFNFAINEFARLAHLPLIRVKLNFLKPQMVIDSKFHERQSFFVFIKNNLSSEVRRVLYLALLCQNGEDGLEELVEATDYFKKNYLISREGVSQVSSELTSQSIKLCLLNINKNLKN